jgi:hypothetical protein
VKAIYTQGTLCLRFAKLRTHSSRYVNFWILIQRRIFELLTDESATAGLPHLSLAVPYFDNTERVRVEHVE